MTKPASTAGAGLRDVVAAPSSICFIDGENWILSYSGYNIHDLAQHSTFEEFGFLLWVGYGISLGNPVIAVPNTVAAIVGAATISVAWFLRRGPTTA